MVGQRAARLAAEDVHGIAKRHQGSHVQLRQTSADPLGVTRRAVLLSWASIMRYETSPLPQGPEEGGWGQATRACLTGHTRHQALRHNRKLPIRKVGFQSLPGGVSQGTEQGLRNTLAQDTSADLLGPAQIRVTLPGFRRRNKKSPIRKEGCHPRGLSEPPWGPLAGHSES